MTKEEFIAQYGAPEEMKTEFGMQFPDGTKRFAMECQCGDETCHGWAMVYERHIEDHKFLFQQEGR